MDARRAREDEGDQRWHALFASVGDFLADNILDPTPAHYDLAYRYLSGQDADLARRVDEATKLHGRLTASAAAGIVALRTAEISAAELTRAAEEAQEQLRQITAIVDRSGQDAREYSDALERMVGTSSSSAVDGLIGVTRAMIEKTRHAEEDLRRTGAEMTQLRESLAEAQRTADTDPLTGLPNRRALDARLRAAVDSARQSRTPFAIAICDIDHFKTVNDVHGHQIGDEVIKFIATELARDATGQPFVARYGGEEFVMLFEGLDPAQAATSIDRIRADIAGREFKVTATGRQLGRLTFSAGIAGQSGRKGYATILKNADAALYRAKEEGRNRVCIAE